jgi:hypothetical protein
MTHLQNKSGAALDKAKMKGCSPDDCYMPQSPEDDRGPNYHNDTPNNWLRGNGMKPGFDKHKAGR